MRKEQILFLLSFNAVPETLASALRKRYEIKCQMKFSEDGIDVFFPIPPAKYN